MLLRIYLTLLACATLAFVSSVPTYAQVRNFSPVTDAVLQNPDPGDWLSWRRTLDGWGYSPLDRIDRDNVGDLRLAWSSG